MNLGSLKSDLILQSDFLCHDDDDNDDDGQNNDDLDDLMLGPSPNLGSTPRIQPGFHRANPVRAGVASCTDATVTRIPDYEEHLMGMSPDMGCSPCNQFDEFILRHAFNHSSMSGVPGGNMPIANFMQLTQAS